MKKCISKLRENKKEKLWFDGGSGETTERDMLGKISGRHGITQTYEKKNKTRKEYIKNKKEHR